MYTKDDLVKQLKAMGIRTTDTLKVHASMRAIGELENGADTLIDALKETVCDGLLVIPTHTWDKVPSHSTVYDSRTDVPCTGAFSVCAAFRKDGVRSLHPSHSVAAFGRDAESFVAGEEKATSPCTPGGITDKMLDRHAKVLLIGIGQEKDTILHGFEEKLNVTNRLSEEAKEVTAIGPDGREYRTHLKCHCRLISMYYPKFDEPFRVLGAYEEFKFCNTTVELCDAVKMYEIMARIVSRTDMELCADHEPIPRKYWEP